MLLFAIEARPNARDINFFNRERLETKRNLC